MPDKKDKGILARLRAGEGEVLKKSTDVPRETSVLSRLNNGEGEVLKGADNTVQQQPSQQPTDQDKEVSRRPVSTQALMGRPAEDAYSTLKQATDVVSNYLGSDFVKPQPGNQVKFTRTKGDNLVEHTYEAGKPMVEDVIQGEAANTRGGKISYEQGPYDSEQVNIARNNIADELKSNQKFLTDFISENQDKLNSFFVRRPDAETGDANVPAAPVQPMGDMLQANIGQMGPVTMDQGMLSPLNIQNRIMNMNGDSKAVADFSQAALKIIDQNYEAKKKDLDARYPMKPQAGNYGNDYQTMARENEPAFNSGMQQLDAAHDNEVKALKNAVGNIAAIKVANEAYGQKKNWKDIDVEDLGISYHRAIGEDAEADKLERLRHKNLLKPQDKVNAQMLGYRALQTKMMDAFANNEDAQAKDLVSRVNNYPQKVLNNNPDYKKQVISGQLADKIYGDKSAFVQSITGYDVTDAEIKKAASELGLSDKDVQGITPDDIAAPGNFLGRVGKSFVGNTAAPLYEFGMRRAGKLAGTDPDVVNNMFDDNWYDNHQVGTRLGGKTPDAMSLFDQDGRFNYNLGAITNTVADGIGQISAFATGGKELGAVAKGAGLLKDAEKADRLGLSAWIYLSGIDRNYKSATDAIGDSPADESKRMALANIYTLSDIIGENILPDTKIADKVFGTASGKKIIDLIKEHGIQGVEKETLSKLFTQGIKEGVKDWAKETSEDVVSLAGNTLGDMVFAPDKYKNADLASQTVQTAVTSAISSAIPTISGGFGNAGRESQLKKNMMMEVGSNPQKYIDEIGKLVDDGAMDAKDGQQRINTINAMTNIVKNSIPKISPSTGQQLTPSQQADYANNLLNETLVNEKKTQVNDPVQEKILDEQAAQLQTQRNGILQGVSNGNDDISFKGLSGLTTVKVPEGTGSLDKVKRWVDKALSHAAVSDADKEKITNWFDQVKATYSSPQKIDINAEANEGDRQENATTQAESKTPGSSTANEGQSSMLTNQQPGTATKSGGTPLFEEEFDDQPIKAAKNIQPVTANANNSNATGQIQNTEPVKADEFSNHSGGAPGSDTVWDKTGREYGVVNHTHYTSPGQSTLDSEELNKSGAKATMASDTDYKEGGIKAEKAAEDLGRVIPEDEKHFVYRDWQQVSKADAVYAIGNMLQKNEVSSRGYTAKIQQLEGGTGYGVQMAINEGKPVFVFDQEKDQWFQAKYNEDNAGKKQFSGFEEIDTPVLTKNFAGIGVTKINDNGRRAIKEVYDKTFGSNSFGTVSQNIKDKFNNAEKIEGRANTRILNDGSKIRGKYVLVDANAVTPSHDPNTFSTSEGFPLLEDGKNPNDRDYTVKENRDRVIARSQNYDGRAVEQVPTVDKNGVVIDGNDRTMSGQIAARQGTDTNYIEALKEKADVYGFSPQQVDDMISKGQHPRVVFLSDNTMPYNTDTFAAFNPRTTGKVKTAIEEAIQFGRTAKPALFNSIGEILKNHETMSDFFNNKADTKTVRDLLVKHSILSPDSVTGYYDNKMMRFTNAGKEMLQNLMFGKAFTEDGLRMLEHYPGIREKVAMAMNNIIAIDSLGPDYSIKEYMTEALGLKDRVDEFAKTNNITDKDSALSQYLAQGDLFDKQQYSQESILLWAILEDGKKSKLRSFTGDYLESARQHAANTGMDIFGNQTADGKEIIKNYINLHNDYEQLFKQRAEATPDQQRGQSGTQPGEQNISGDNADTQSSGPAEAERPATEQVEGDNGQPVADEQPSAPGSISSDGFEQNTPLNDAINEYNKYNDFIRAKERKIELLEQSGKRDSEEWKREQAFLHKYKSNLKEALRAVEKLQAKEKANNLRKLKKDPKNSDIVQNAILPISDVKVYNAAIEIAAQAIERGTAIKHAVQQAVDFVNNRWFTRWDEQAFRNELGENQAFPLTADELRSKKADDTELTVKNKAAADQLIQSVKDDNSSMSTIIRQVNILDDVSQKTKDKIINYIKENVKAFYKEEGRNLAVDYLNKSGNDFDDALVKMGNDINIQILSSTNETERENLRNKFAYGKSYLEGQRTINAVKGGNITPVKSYRGEAQQSEFKLPERKLQDIVQENTQDRYARLERAQQAAIKPINKSTDAVTAFRTKKSKAFYQIDKVRDYIGNTNVTKIGSLYDRMHKAGIDIQKFGWFLYARHAQERNEYNAGLREKIYQAKLDDLNQKLANAKTPEASQKITSQIQDILNQTNPKYILMPDGGSGMTNQQAKDIIDEVQNSGDLPKYEEFEKEFRDNVVNKIIDYKYDAGIIDDKGYNHLKTFYQNYVPLKVDTDEEKGQSDGKYVSNSRRNGRDLYRSKGASDRTFSERHNPMLQAMVDLENAITRYEENRANVALANLTRTNPNPSVWEVRPARYDFLTDNNGNIVHAEEVDVPQNAVAFYEDGKKKYVVLHDKGLQNMIRQVGSERFNRIVSMPSRWITNFATLRNPEFLATNPIMDQQDAYMSLLGDKNPQMVKKFRGYVKDVFKIAKTVYTGKGGEWADWLEDWKKHGGEISFKDQVTVEKQAANAQKLFERYDNPMGVKNQWHKFVNVLDNASTALEQTTRLMAYRAAVESGASKDKAAVISRNATVDFEKKGVYGTYINAFKAFANAGTQGLANLGYLTLKSPRVRKFIGAMILSGAVEAMVNDLMGDCDDPTGEDCYWEKPEWEKQRSFILKNPFGKGFAELRTGRQFAWFNYVGKSLYGWMRGKVSPGEFVTNTVGSLLNFYNPIGGDAPLEQQFAGNLAPAVGLKTNVSSFNSPISPEESRPMMHHENYWPNTPQSFVGAASFLSNATGGNENKGGLVDVSPNKLQYLVQSAFSGLYNFGSDALSSASNAIQGEDVKANDIPFSRAFYRTSNMSKTKEKYFQLADESKHEMFDKEKQAAVKEVLNKLLEGGQITKDQWGRRFRYIEQNQTAFRNRNNKKDKSGEDDNKDNQQINLPDVEENNEDNKPAEPEENTDTTE